MKNSLSRKASLSALLERMLSVLVVFLLLAATAVSAGRFFGTDFGAPSPEAADAAAPDAEAVSRLGLSSMRFSPAGPALWNVASPDGAPCGVLAGSAPHAEGVSGYGGPTPVYVYFDARGRVAGIVPLENAESPDFFRRVTDSGLLERWNGLSAEQAAAQAVDAVSGATYSSRSVIKNVQAVLAAHPRVGAVAAASSLPAGPLPLAAWAVVVAAGVFGAFFLRRRRSFRVVLLALNVLVAGFWCGTSLSVTLLRGWLLNGLDWAVSLPVFLVLLLSLLLAFLKRPRHYCNWICPLGSLQELAYLLPGPKVRVGARTFRWLGRIRLAALMLLLFALWMGVGEAVLSYEPFSAFQVASASPAVLALAAVIVVTAVFVPRPWCRTLCPVGELFSLSEDAKPAS